tara:strand:- start:7048 stop:7740 length:693 start_codon:yes stop_codon:yes gene_type:complete
MIQIKTRACKGIGKAKDFQGCGKPVLRRKYGLCMDKCYKDWLFTTEEGKKIVNKTIVKVSKTRRDLEKAKNGGLINYSQKLQSKVNQIVRFIDKSEPCLAKGIFSKQVHAGHIYSRGSNPTIKYNLHNIHRQSAQSNHFQNEDGLLREGLMQEYGKDYYDFVSELRRTPSIKYTNEEYKSFYKKACKLYNELKKALKPFKTENKRINERNRINLELNIYAKEYCVFKRKH